MKEKYRVAVLGGPASGKTTLVHRFVHGTYNDKYEPTVEETLKKTFFCGGAPVQLEIVDTAGREQFPGMLERYIQTADAFAVLYSVRSEKSYEEAERLLLTIARIRGPMGVARVLVGAQMDSLLRSVSHERGAALSAQMQCSFAESSAALNINVVEIFDELVSQIRYISGMRRTLDQPTHPDQWYPTKPENMCCFL